MKTKIITTVNDQFEVIKKERIITLFGYEIFRESLIF